MSELPQGWAATEFEQIADIKLGKMLDEAKNRGEPTRYLRNVNVRWGTFDLDDISHMPMSSDERVALRIGDGDILVCEGGEPGRSAVWDGGPTDLTFQKALMRMRPRGGIEPRLLAAFLRWSYDSGALERHFTGTTIKHLPQAALSRLPLDLPPLPEQRRIVAKVDSLTGKSRRASDHLDHIPRLVEKYKRAVLAAAFRGDLTREWRGENASAKWSSHELDVLNEQRQSYLKTRRGSRLHSNSHAEAQLPDNWFSAQLSDVGALQVGYAYKSKWYAADGVRLLRGANVAPGNVSWEDEVKLPHDIAADYADYRLDAGDIVIAMDRPIISTGLKVARISDEDAGCLLVQRVARYAASELVDRDYVWHLINSQHFIDHAVTQATGSDLPHISSNDILTTPVPLPCLSEQREIARRIGTALSWIDRLASEATSARRLIDRLDQAVLAKAFRGELVPQDPDDEPASVLLDRIRAERGAAPKARRGRKAKVL